jgi:TIR domain
MPRATKKNERKPQNAERPKAAKRETTIFELSWGPVLINGGRHRGRVGYYDDDDHDGAIIYFGDFFIADGYYIIPHQLLQYATLDSLLRRREEIQTKITWANPNSQVSKGRKYDLLAELFYIDSTINDRMFFARYGEPRKDGRKLFMSHSSIDKWFVNKVADDLKILGHDVWLDERDIKVGQSIPQAIQKGIHESDYVILFLSPNSVFSRWVKVEWVSKFMSEVESGNVKVLPALIEPCEVPALLRTEKYADFTKNYDQALRGLLDAIV